MRLQYAADTLESIMERILLVSSGDLCHHQACDAFVQDQLSGIDDLSQLSQHALDLLRIGYQKVDYLCPSLVQTLVPDAGRKEGNICRKML